MVKKEIIFLLVVNTSCSPRIISFKLAVSDNYDVVLFNESTKIESTIQVTATESDINANLRRLKIPFTLNVNNSPLTERSANLRKNKEAINISAIKINTV